MASSPQGSLENLLEDTRRVRVIEDGIDRGRPIGSAVLLDTEDPAALAGLRQALQIAGQSEPCLCAGDPTIELLSGSGASLALIGVHHGFAIRWSRGDAALQDGRLLLDWLASHGVPGPLETVLDDQRRRKERARGSERWFAAMPSCLEPHRDLVRNYELSTEATQTLVKALQQALPDSAERALALFEWYGSGAGSWHNYTAYECIPQLLLHETPVPELVLALGSDSVSAAQLEGAARYFAVGVLHDNSKMIEVAQMPREAARRLLEHVQKSEDERNRNVASSVFG